jgi:hypothetical protein
MAWAVLAAVALEATAEAGGLVAYTSARHVADLLGLDPGTAASALRLVRQRGLLELRRTNGSGGRFGLSDYGLGDLVELGLRPCVAAPGTVAPHAADPHGHRGAETGTAPWLEQAAGRRRRSPAEPGVQGSFDLDLEIDG